MRNLEGDLSSSMSKLDKTSQESDRSLSRPQAYKDWNTRYPVSRPSQKALVKQLSNYEVDWVFTRYGICFIVLWRPAAAHSRTYNGVQDCFFLIYVYKIWNFFIVLGLEACNMFLQDSQ